MKRCLALIYFAWGICASIAQSAEENVGEGASFNTTPKKPYGELSVLPPELIKERIGKLSLGTAIRLNKSFLELLTGCSEGAKVPFYSDNNSIKLEKIIVFELNMTPKFIWNNMVGVCNNLPEEYWPYIKDTQIHTLSFEGKKIDNAKLCRLSGHLEATCVKILNLRNNLISNTGAKDFALTLLKPYVLTIDLRGNQLTYEDSIKEFLRSLEKGTTIDLRYNACWSTNVKPTLISEFPDIIFKEK